MLITSKSFSLIISALIFSYLSLYFLLLEGGIPLFDRSDPVFLWLDKIVFKFFWEICLEMFMESVIADCNYNFEKDVPCLYKVNDDFVVKGFL